MPVTQDKPAPYAPTSAILDLLERHRQKGLPSPVNADVLARAGIQDSLVSRTFQALQSLDLIDEEGRPTQVLEGIRLAPEAEYKNRLLDWLNSAYADALNFIDPMTADETQIRDSFRVYKPVGQQSRMVTLFTGLYAAAGIGGERPRKPANKNGKNDKPSTRPQKNERPEPESIISQPTYQVHRQNNAMPGLPPALAGLMVSLPTEGRSWTKAERDRFVNTFGAVLDFCFPVDVVGKQMPRKPHDMEDENT